MAGWLDLWRNATRMVVWACIKQTSKGIKSARGQHDKMLRAIDVSIGGWPLTSTRRRRRYKSSSSSSSSSSANWHSKGCREAVSKVILKYFLAQGFTSERARDKERERERETCMGGWNSVSQRGKTKNDEWTFDSGRSA